MVLAVAVLSASSAAHADALRVDATAETMRIDGALREWRGAHFAELGQAKGPHLRFAIASDEAGLYLGAEVDDTAVVRTRSIDGNQDAIVLHIQAGDEPDAPTKEIWLLPGITGTEKALAAVASAGSSKRTLEPRVKVVEGPRKDTHGYVLEAFLPFEVLFGKTLWETGRAGLRLEAMDPGGRAPMRLASIPPGERLPRFQLGQGHVDYLASFLAEKQRSGLLPARDLQRNVAGDGAAERVLLIDKYVLAYGPGIADGKSYAYFELPVSTGADVESFELLDFDRDGRFEIALRLRQKNELGLRTLYTVLTLEADRFSRVFAAEVKKSVGAQTLENRVTVRQPAKGKVTLVLGAGGENLDARAPFEERSATDATPLLTPWGAVRERSYAFDGRSFAQVGEVAQSVAIAQVQRAEPPQTKRTDDAPVLLVPSEAQLLAHFKRALKLAPDAEPTQRLRGNLLGEAGDEALCVYGASFAVLGSEVGGGTSYAAFSLPVAADAVQRVWIADVTGDGRSEILVRVTQALSGAEGATRALLFVLRVDEEGRFTRILQREVARRMGEREIENRVVTRDGKLVIEAGHVRGWSGTSYPFADEATGGAEPLLLPWKGRAITYRAAGQTLIPVP
ncbi:MAG: hypothetical protein RL385_2463 [Pseudomonadota bacterium]|jgi:hypothetical protein